MIFFFASIPEHLSLFSGCPVCLATLKTLLAVLIFLVIVQVVMEFYLRLSLSVMHIIYSISAVIKRWKRSVVNTPRICCIHSVQTYNNNNSILEK